MNKEATAFFLQLQTCFGMPFTSLQQQAAYKLAEFAVTRDERPAFLLRGYAGTGKTTLVGAFVKALRAMNRGVVLLAPTGRAAKVLANHAGGDAYTIHKAIYRQQTFAGQDTRFDLGFNKQRGTIFVVDEASMIARGGGYDSMFGTGCLLDDLVEFVYSCPGCGLLLVGDTAQLPPVGESSSPALQDDVMHGYGLSLWKADLTEVVRQQAASSVLAAATSIRRQLSEQRWERPSINVSKAGEVRYLPGDELIEQLVGDYEEFGTDETIIITRSNKRANLYNEGIRRRIMGKEDYLTRGDRVMAVKNNYYWTEMVAKQMKPGERLPFEFVANGDCAELVRLSNVHDQYGFLFADATLRFSDYDNYELDCRVLLSTLTSESPSLTSDESQRLYEQVLADYADLPNKQERLQKMREDPYYNALQLKYAYAVTCHKAQGGQWARVYIDQGYIPDDADPVDYLRWLYTAITRTTERVYLVNWPHTQLMPEQDD